MNKLIILAGTTCLLALAAPAFGQNVDANSPSLLAEEEGYSFDFSWLGLLGLGGLAGLYGRKRADGKGTTDSTVG